MGGYGQSVRKGATLQQYAKRTANGDKPHVSVNSKRCGRTYVPSSSSSEHVTESACAAGDNAVVDPTHSTAGGPTTGLNMGSGA